MWLDSGPLFGVRKSESVIAGFAENDPGINLYDCSIFGLSKIVSSILKKVDCAIVENQVVICSYLWTDPIFKVLPLTNRRI